MALASVPPQQLTSVSVDHSVGAWNDILIATHHLRGECVIVEGHPLWARTARTVLYSIELVVTPLHPRAVFDSAEQGYPWALARAGYPADREPALREATNAIIAANHRLR